MKKLLWLLIFVCLAVAVSTATLCYLLATPVIAIITISQPPVEEKLPYYGNNDYDRIILASGKIYGVNPCLIKAMMKVESNFNPDDISEAGAKGLLQIMPKTFSAFSADAPRIHSTSPRSREIEVGVRYMRHLLDRTNSLEEFLASYNAGPTYVASLTKEKGWEQKLPPETQQYILKVKSLLRQP